jgi:GTP-binding protein
MGEEHSKAPLPFRKKPQFVLGAPDQKFFPNTDLPEIAVIGRSNVGKSSLINALLGIKNLARTSKTPGRTREINFFAIGGNPPLFHLVDLPGYGFAKISKSDHKYWRALCESYLRDRPQLKRALLLVDSRHDMMDVDQQMLDLLVEWRTPVSIVLTKTDGSKKAQLAAHEAHFTTVQANAATLYPPLFKTSSAKREGLRTLQDDILKMLSV